jgi:enterochelin esterase-like enzyme
VREVWYHSSVTGSWRHAFVYLPPNYDSSKARYPVLYLQHGGGENESGWIRQGKANFILDNLIASGNTRPMIVVMANGYATRSGYQVPDLTGERFGSPAFVKVMQERMGAFEDDMTQVLIPFVDKTFRTVADRDHRAMAGLSMGGMQTFQVTFDHLDLFSYIGGFSGASNVFLTGTAKLDTKTAFHGAMADPAAFAAKVHLLWIGVGTNEPERMKTSLENLNAALDEGNIKHVFYQSPGTDHEWQTWRRDLKDFAPRLFQSGSKGSSSASRGSRM